MKEKGISVEEAFGAISMERILEESHEAGRQPAGDQRSEKKYRQKTNRLNPLLSKKEKRSLRRKGL